MQPRLPFKPPGNVSSWGTRLMRPDGSQLSPRVQLWWDWIPALGTCPTNVWSFPIFEVGRTTPPDRPRYRYLLSEGRNVSPTSHG